MFSSRLTLYLAMPRTRSVCSGRGSFPPRGLLQALVPVADPGEHSALFLLNARSHIKPQALVTWSVTVSQLWSRNWKTSGGSSLSDSCSDRKYLLD